MSIDEDYSVTIVNTPCLIKFWNFDFFPLKFTLDYYLGRLVFGNFPPGLGTITSNKISVVANTIDIYYQI